MGYHPRVIHRSAVLLLACVPLFSQSYTISTIVGGASAGLSLYNPTSVALDPAGDLYFADWSGLVRKLWARDGSISAVAGVGVTGFSGDGGPAVAAMLGKGISLAVDPTGNLYIADSDNNRIRRVDAITGIITTVAGTGASVDSGDGGPAVSAGVARPTGVTVDGAGNVLFSNWSRVRRIDAQNGVIETVAGQFTTSFGGDGGLALDAEFWDPVPFLFRLAGDLYVADYENSRIRLISAKTGIVTTVAGSGSCTSGPPPFSSASVCKGGFAGDGGPAVKAALNYPAAVALDEEGNMFIADTLNHRIRLVDAATAIIYTIAGDGTEGFRGDGGPALHAEISFPASIAIDAFGRIFFSDENNQRIRMLTPVRPLFFGGRQRRPAISSPAVRP
jgi:sugar lactone lactonase YvrE